MFFKYFRNLTSKSIQTEIYYKLEFLDWVEKYFKRSLPYVAGRKASGNKLFQYHKVFWLTHLLRFFTPQFIFMHFQDTFCIFWQTNQPKKGEFEASLTELKNWHRMMSTYAALQSRSCRIMLGSCNTSDIFIFSALLWALLQC